MQLDNTIVLAFQKAGTGDLTVTIERVPIWPVHCAHLKCSQLKVMLPQLASGHDRVVHVIEYIPGPTVQVEDVGCGPHVQLHVSRLVSRCRNLFTVARNALVSLKDLYTTKWEDVLAVSLAMDWPRQLFHAGLIRLLTVFSWTLTLLDLGSQEHLWTCGSYDLQDRQNFTARLAIGLRLKVFFFYL